MGQKSSASKPNTRPRLTDVSHADGRGDDPVTGPLAETSYPEMGQALRSRIKPLLQDWEKQVRRVIPAADTVSFVQFLDHLPEILAAMADALASADSKEVKRLMERSPSQGIHRFQLHYDVAELATEDRMLRRLILEHVEAALGRRTSLGEAVALTIVGGIVSTTISVVEHVTMPALPSEILITTGCWPRVRNALSVTLVEVGGTPAGTLLV